MCSLHRYLPGIGTRQSILRSSAMVSLYATPTPGNVIFSPAAPMPAGLVYARQLVRFPFFFFFFSSSTPSDERRTSGL